MGETDFARNVTGFLSRYLPGQRNVSVNTVASYRDAFKLLLLFCETEKRMKADRIRLAQITAELVLEYLAWLQQVRHCGISTRNQRLAALKSFYRYVAAAQPELLLECQRILAIPMKKVSQSPMSFFSPEGLHLLLSQPDTTTRRGRRDHALLVLLYDSAARVQELIDIRVRDIRLEEPPTVTLYGKGRKTRIVPITSRAASTMKGYFRERGWLGTTAVLDMPVFTNNRKSKLSRAGVSHILNKYVNGISSAESANVPISVSPHCLRHSRAVHLLRSGVPLIYIRDFLGHVSVTTTEIYARVDSEERRKALEGAYEVPSQDVIPDWENDKGLISWLTQLCR